MPPPETYSAVPPVPSIRLGGGFLIVTFSLNSTVMLIVSPAAYALSSDGEVTLTTYAGVRRISWTPGPQCEATMACWTLPSMNVSTPEAPLSTPKSLWLFFAHPADVRFPSASMRIIWMPRSARSVTIAYVVPFVTNVSMSYGLFSCLKSYPSSSIAESAAERAPSGWMRISWTPPSWLPSPMFQCEPTSAYAIPFVSKARTVSGVRITSYLFPSESS